MSEKFDVSISFAGEDRKIAKEIATKLKSNGVLTFYDDFEKVNLWGKDLYEHLINVYNKDSKYCLMLLSKNYSEKLWTTHERKAAQARAFKENREYILPLKLDDTEIPGVLDTTGYIDLRSHTIDDVVELILSKLWGNVKGDFGLENLTNQLEELYGRTMLFCEFAFHPKNHSAYGKGSLAIELGKEANAMYMKLRDDVKVNSSIIERLVLKQLTGIMDSFSNILNRAAFLTNLRNPTLTNHDFISEIPVEDFEKVYSFLKRLEIFKDYDRSSRRIITPDDVINCWKSAEKENNQYYSNPFSYKHSRDRIPMVFNFTTMRGLSGSGIKHGDLVKTYIQKS